MGRKIHTLGGGYIDDDWDGRARILGDGGLIDDIEDWQDAGEADDRWPDSSGH